MKNFKQKNSNKPRRIMTWDETVKIMRNEDLDNRADKVIDVIFSLDSAHRFVILKSDDNYLTYLFESLKVYEDEIFMSSFDDNPSAFWAPQNNEGKHIFDDMETLMRELTATPEYKLYFENK